VTALATKSGYYKADSEAGGFAASGMEDVMRKLLAATALCTSMLFMLPAPGFAQPAGHDWAGPYLGLALSGIASRVGLDTTTDGTTFSDDGLPTHYDLFGTNFAPGLTAGYNFQSGNLVFGVEGDASALRLQNSVSGQGSSSGSYTVTDELDSLLTLRGRFGVVEGNALIYGTAGVAGGQASFNAEIGGNGNGLETPATGSGFVAGPVVGAGIEYALTDKLSVKAEGKIYSLASLSGIGDTGKGGVEPNPPYSSIPDPYTATYHPQGAMFTTGLNLHF
jgi:outer membrane immunogenic protein